MWHTFLTAFIPLFVAIDALGMVPLFLSLAEGLNEERRQKLIYQATLTALAISVVFLFLGKAMFRFLGITENDFRIGGGIVLLVLAVNDLLFSDFRQRNPGTTTLGVVPLGIPLMIGPAALTTILITSDSVGYPLTLVSLILNLLIAWVIFAHSQWVVRILGKDGAKAFAKVASLFLTAIAIMMIRVGMTNILANK